MLIQPSEPGRLSIDSLTREKLAFRPDPNFALARGMIRIALTLLLVLAACSPEIRTQEPSTSVDPAVAATAPPYTAAPVRTDRSSYVLGVGPAGKVTIVTALRAPADQTLYIMNCNGASGVSLQRKVGEEWVSAWAVAMNACLSPPLVIRPGEEHSATLELHEDAANAVHPAGGKLESGTYRVVWTGVLTSFDPDVPPFGPELPLEGRVSAPFRIDVPR